MKHIGTLALTSIVFAGCAAEPAATERTGTGVSALTTADTDVAPECVGILTYVNIASLPDLDSVLPSNVASAIVARRAVRPFTSIADLSSVPGIAQGVLAQIVHHTRQIEFIGEECAGVFEELTVSAEDAEAILAYANTASSAELVDVVRAEFDATTAALIAARPITSLQELADISGVGISTFRSLRDAAIDGPFDLLVDRVNAADRTPRLATAFNWLSVLFQEPGHPRSIECFGISPDIVGRVSGSIRPNLADGVEVLAQVTGTVSRFSNTREGLADLEAQVAGQTFFGCYLRFSPDPWSGIDRAFFVNTRTGYRVFTETRWSE
jgi:DNA uptake protein ComE-like DNA-binding protein